MSMRKMMIGCLVGTMCGAALTGCTRTAPTVDEVAATPYNEVTTGASEKETLESASNEVVWTENLLDPSNPVTVKFYSYSYASPAFGEGFETLMNRFNEGVGKEKGVVLEMVADSGGNKASTDVKAGLPVDMIQNAFQSIDGARLDIGIQSFEEVFPQEEMDAHFEGISENCLELGMVDDQMYGLAFTFSTPILYVNGKLFEEAGLDPEVAPKDWDELYEMCQTIKEKTGKYGLALSPENSTGWVTDSILYSAGASVLNEDRTEAVFASETGINTFETWKRLYTDDVALPGADMETLQAFLTGEAAMHIQSTSVYTSIVGASQAGGWTLYGHPMPGFNGEASIPTNSGSAIVVRPDSDQKAQAIWEVVKYLTGDEGYTIITSEIGYLPLRPYLAEDENYLKGFVDANPIIKMNIGRLSSIKASTIWPGKVQTTVQGLYGDMAVKALTTDADVAQTLEEYQGMINKYLNK